MEEKDISIMMKVCVILHNMIVDDERNNYELVFDYDIVEVATSESIVRYRCHAR